MGAAETRKIAHIPFNAQITYGVYTAYSVFRMSCVERSPDARRSPETQPHGVVEHLDRQVVVPVRRLADRVSGGRAVSLPAALSVWSNSSVCRHCTDGAFGFILVSRDQCTGW